MTVEKQGSQIRLEQLLLKVYHKEYEGHEEALKFDENILISLVFLVPFVVFRQALR